MYGYSIIELPPHCQKTKDLPAAITLFILSPHMHNTAAYQNSHTLPELSVRDIDWNSSPISLIEQELIPYIHIYIMS